MSDAKLKKKVLLRRKTETPVVQLKRKGETAAAVHLKKKTEPTDTASVVSTTAVAAGAVAFAEKTAASAAGATAQQEPIAAATGMGAAPAKTASSTSNANVKTDSSPAAGQNAAGSLAGAGGLSGTDGHKNGGKIWRWVIGAIAVAGLTFGGFKLANNSGDKSASYNSAVEGIAQDGTESDAAETQTGEVYNPEGNNEGITPNSTNADSESSTTSLKASSDGNTTANGANSNKANGYQPANPAVNGSNPSQANPAAGSTVNGSSSNGVRAAASVVRGSATSGTAANGSVSNRTSVATADKAIAGGSSIVNSSNASTATANVLKPTVVKAVSEYSATCFFAFDSISLDESEVLNKMAENAKASGKKVIINAFADETGEAEYNQVLSQRRADAVKNYFVNRGVDVEFISAVGNGESRVYSTKAENRRADISIQ